MFCTNCGKELLDGSTFCTNCGSKLKKDVSMTSTTDYQESDQNVNTLNAAPKNKNRIPKIIAVALVIVILVIAGIYALPRMFDVEIPIFEILDTETDEEQIASIISEAEDLAVNEDYEGALAKINTGLETFPESDDLLQKFEEYMVVLNAQLKAAVLDEAAALAESDDYAAAMALIEEAQTQDPDDAEYASAYEKYKEENEKQENNRQIMQAAIEEADEYAKSNDFLSAMKTINNALSQVGENADLQELYSVYCSSYVSAIISQVDSYITEDQLYEADDILNVALTNAPDETELVEKKAVVEALLPVSITSIELFNYGSQHISDITWNEESPTDPFGNDYSDCQNYSIVNGGYGNAYAEYRVEGKYSAISGTLSPYTDIAEDGSIYMQIFVDGQLTYTSPLIERKTEPFSFTVDIKNAEYIKIVVTIKDNGGSLIMSDVLLSPDNTSDESSEDTVSLVAISLLERFNYGSSHIGEITWDSGFPEDVGENDYSCCQNYSIVSSSYGSAYVEYRLGGEYKTLSGSLSPYVNIDENGSIYIQIFCDDELIYTSPDITSKTDKFDFSVDVSGVNYLKFVVQIKDNGGALIMSDVFLEKAS